MHHKAFTLMEMIIVLVIMGIITLMIIGLTGTQLQKLQRKTVKDSLLTEYQNRYSKNLTSSVFAGKRYGQMIITFTQGSNEMKFAYLTENTPIFTDTFLGDFQVASIITNPNTLGNAQLTDTIDLKLQPYEIPCIIGEGLDEVVLIITMKQQKKYAFSISNKSCRMREVKCDISRGCTDSP
jgi:prepilin-type N-terminal cleavage/methylation domain-containing protein